MKKMILLAGVLAVLGEVAAQTPVLKPATPTNVPPAATNSARRQAQEGELQGGVPASALSPEVRTKLQEASKQLQTAQKAHYQRMSEIRREIEAMGRAETIDEKAIREKAREIGTIEGELAVLRARHHKEIKGFLPKEQFDQLQQGGPARPAVQQRLNRVVERAGTNAIPTNRPPSPPTSRVPTNAVPTKR